LARVFSHRAESVQQAMDDFRRHYPARTQYEC
jgi:hypothetical protein